MKNWIFILLICLIPTFSFAQSTFDHHDLIQLLMNQQTQIHELRTELQDLKGMLRKEKEFLQERKAQTERERMIDLYLRAGLIKY